MLKMFIDMIKGFFVFLKFPIIAIIILCGVFFVNYIIWTAYYLKKGKRFQKGKIARLIKRNILIRIFWDTPKQYALDIINRKPDFFRPQGLIIFEGAQGTGKTSSMVRYAMDLQKQYTKAKCITNLAYKYQDKELTHWKQLIEFKNEIYGVIVLMDELQNWFNSNQSKDFPPEMLEVVTQNRKNRRVILGTAQNFYMLAKNIRTQTTEVRQCVTFLGCLTLVRRRKPIVDTDGNVKEWKNKGFYMYVHDENLRTAYDTWKVIESLARSGFKERQNDSTIVNYVKVEK